MRLGCVSQQVSQFERAGLVGCHWLRPSPGHCGPEEQSGKGFHQNCRAGTEGKSWQGRACSRYISLKPGYAPLNPFREVGCGEPTWSVQCQLNSQNVLNHYPQPLLLFLTPGISPEMTSWHGFSKLFCWVGIWALILPVFEDEMLNLFFSLDPGGSSCGRCMQRRRCQIDGIRPMWIQRTFNQDKYMRKRPRILLDLTRWGVEKRFSKDFQQGHLPSRGMYAQNFHQMRGKLTSKPGMNLVIRKLE